MFYNVFPHFQLHHAFHISYCSRCEYIDKVDDYTGLLLNSVIPLNGVVHLPSLEYV